MDMPNLTVGNHAYERNDGVYTPLSLCKEFYRRGSISPDNETFDIDPVIEKGDTHYLLYVCLSVSLGWAVVGMATMIH